MRTPRLLCIGDLNADITITSSSPIAVGSDTPGSVRLTGGGSAANVAAAAASTGAGELAVRFAGVVGDDLLGDVLVDELRGLGIDTRVGRRTATSSRAIAAIVTPDGDRSMVSDLTTATAFILDDLDTAWFDDVDWLHLTGYTSFAPGGREIFRWLVAAAKERSIPWSLDPSSAEMLRSNTIEMDGVAILFPSADEAEALTGLGDPAAAAAALLDLADTAVVTCGADGAHLARRGRPQRHAPAEPVTVANALGCGDAFAGGFLAARLRGGDDERCLRDATSVAASVARLPGSR